MKQPLYPTLYQINTRNWLTEQGRELGRSATLAPFADIAGMSVLLRALFSPVKYDRAGSDLAGRGLFLDMPPWGHHAFELDDDR